MSTGKRATPSWLSDEAIERAYALGREMEEFLLRRERRKRLNPNAKVNIGPRLRKLLANLDRDGLH
jgi:hypothetical protein